MPKNATRLDFYHILLSQVWVKLLSTADTIGFGMCLLQMTNKSFIDSPAKQKAEALIKMKGKIPVVCRNFHRKL